MVCLKCDVSCAASLSAILKGRANKSWPSLEHHNDMRVAFSFEAG